MPNFKPFLPLHKLNHPQELVIVREIPSLTVVFFSLKCVPVVSPTNTVFLCVRLLHCRLVTALCFALDWNARDNTERGECQLFWVPKRTRPCKELTRKGERVRDKFTTRSMDHGRSLLRMLHDTHVTEKKHVAAAHQGLCSTLHVAESTATSASVCFPAPQKLPLNDSTSVSRVVRLKSVGNGATTILHGQRLLSGVQN